MDIVREIEDISLQPEFQKRVTTFLEQICSIDTSPAQELSSLRENEHRVFHIIETQLKSLHFPESETVLKEISPVICDHPSYSVPYYAFGATQEVYEGRHNLLYMVNPTVDHSGRGTALNAHIDTVPPYFSPSLDKDVLSGRGSADDKGNIAVIIGTLLILDKLLRRRQITLRNRLTAMFVIDEEIGGNGSLDLVIDKRINERFDSILVLECTDNNIHPANRGAIFIKCEGIASAMDKRYEDDISIEIIYWIAKDTDLLIKSQLDFSIDMSSIYGTFASDDTIIQDTHIEVLYSDYNSPVIIELPPEATQEP